MNYQILVSILLPVKVKFMSYMKVFEGKRTWGQVVQQSTVHNIKNELLSLPPTLQKEIGFIS